ncbi:MAG TPA: fused MFS/spermidine synthase [Thermoanaerobaculia bacterium]|nr:fused MFS/spermidine synthase [Thermoanaerobaculia bacterium]
MLLYALTIFLGAFLLFQIQPLMGKYVLPWFGGAPAVWSTCLVFFQLVLLAGYLYAHALATQIPRRAARVVHAALLLVSLAVLGALVFAWPSPILPGSSWKPPDPGEPIGRILAILLVSVGLPYLLLSSTSPLIQSWAARTHPTARVYRLYALSNLGSLLALVTYPTLVERYIPLRLQSWLWSGTFALYSLCFLVCSIRSAGALPLVGSTLVVPSEREEPPPLPAEDGRGEGNFTLITNHKSQITNSPWLWFLLSAAGSMMLMATTNELCQEVAAIPFLWVLPLCLYLLTFILVFQSDRIYSRAVFGPLLLFALCAAAYVLFKGFVVAISIQIAAYSAALFASCMVLHGELVRARPDHSRLTSFYLTISAGGAAGGIFVALLAPLLFRGFWEYHIAVFFTGALAIAALVQDGTSWVNRGRPWPALLAFLVAVLVLYYARDPDLFKSAMARRLSVRFLFSSSSGWLAVGAGVAAILLILRLRLLTAPGRPVLATACLAGALTFLGLLLIAEIQSSQTSSVFLTRNFYGVLTVDHLAAGIPDSDRLDLRHGRIVHGFQYQDPEKRKIPTTYYGANSGIDLAFAESVKRLLAPLRVGIVGLGTGTIAAYGKPGETFRFFDINPAVIALSTGPSHIFTYLADSPARIEIVPGDARLSLERESARNAPRYDILAIDAFTSDAIPVHLLTREAVEIYLSRLEPGGILALHLSNRQLNLVPVAQAVASGLRLPLCIVDRDERGEAVWATTWALYSRDPSALAIPRISASCTHKDDKERIRLWTDDYSNFFQLIK